MTPHKMLIDEIPTVRMDALTRCDISVVLQLDTPAPSASKRSGIERAGRVRTEAFSARHQASACCTAVTASRSGVRVSPRAGKNNDSPGHSSPVYLTLTAPAWVHAESRRGKIESRATTAKF